ncbi:MAG: PD-(D/E)XK nuclease family protein, partial [Novosphingobium sp.]|nr:PD-(D/E)XK nuclease family protein [Novosphingobium sp.]
EPLPLWLERQAPTEPRPARPFAPSALGEEDAPDPPWPPGAGDEAARRGTLIHRLLERLPEVAASDRKAAGLAWLQRHAREFSAPQHQEMLESALAVISNQDWAELFGPASLAEAPVVAVVGERVIAGTIDRLVIAPDRISFIDYKTTRRPPASLEEVPRPILLQMAAYAAVLEVIHPGRSVHAALLYTSAPRLLAIPEEILKSHKLDLSKPQ